MAITSSFANLATVTRASKKTDAGGWDFTSGGTVGTLTEYASGVAATHATAGLLLEDATTNEIRNPRFEGGVNGTLAGSGSLPTYFVDVSLAFKTAGAEFEYGTVSGREYIDIIFDGVTPSSAMQLGFEGPAQVAAADGETFTLSCELQLISGSFANVDLLYMRMLERTGAGALVAAKNGPNVRSAVDSNCRRFFYTETMSGGGTVGAVDPRLTFGWTSGALTFRLRVFAPQIEKKAYPTSLVLPTASSPAASTRAADLVLFDPGSWFSSTAWSAFFSFKPATAGVTGKVLGGFGDTSDDAVYLEIGASSGTRASATVKSGGSTSATLTPSGQSDYAVADTLRVAIGAEADNFAMSLNGATQATDTSGSMPVSNARLSLGNGPSSATANSTFCGYITDFRYFPRRLSNAELEALVGN